MGQITSRFETAFGIRPRNPFNSWSARDGDTVVVTLWQDTFKLESDGTLSYSQPNYAAWYSGGKAPGARPFMDDLMYARARKLPVNIIIASPKGRQNAYGYPAWQMRVVFANPHTGAYRLEQIVPQTKQKAA